MIYRFRPVEVLDVHSFLNIQRKKMMKKINVIIDTDVDFDDYMAMIYLLKHPDVNVLGIMVTGVGAVHLSHGLKNVNDMLMLFNDEAIQNIPVIGGTNAPLLYSNTFPYVARQAADQHYDAPFPGTNSKPVIPDLQTWLLETLKKAEEPVPFLPRRAKKREKV